MGENFQPPSSDLSHVNTLPIFNALREAIEKVYKKSVEN